MAPIKEKVDSDIRLNSVAAATTCEFYVQETSSLASVYLSDQKQGYQIPTFN